MPPEDEPDRRRAEPSRRPQVSMRYASMGFEFAAAIGGFALIGWWIDRHWQIESQLGLLICTSLGVVGGLYNLIRQAIAATRESQPPGRSRRGEPDGGSDRPSDSGS